MTDPPTVTVRRDDPRGFVDPTTTPAGLEDQLLSSLGPLDLYGLVVNVVTAVWSAAIWRFGLEEGRNLSDRAATGLAVTASLLIFLYGL